MTNDSNGIDIKFSSGNKKMKIEDDRLMNMEQYFHLHDNENKGYLDENDFYAILKALFSKETKPNHKDFFKSFDKNCDGKIDLDEFKTLWNCWLKKLLYPVSALIIIDVQNDFIDGTLALKNCPAKQDANEIIPVINNIIDNFKFDVIVYTLDQHPENHISFFENLKLFPLHEDFKKDVSEIKPFDSVVFAGPPKMEQKLWPKHCIQDSWGAQLHENLKIVENSVEITKGSHKEVDSYSAFFDNMQLSRTKLHEELQNRNVTHLFICGVAFDYCVAFTVLDALNLGYATTVIKNATCGVDLSSIEIKTKEMKDKNAVIADVCDLNDLICGEKIKIEYATVFENFIKE